MMIIASPIPDQPTLPETLPAILEINEPLIPLKQYALAIEVYPAYYHDGLPGSRPDCLVRPMRALPTTRMNGGILIMGTKPGLP
ncbi:MAG: hypothetical protein K0R47_1833 [Brevibacillus sp.]|nr:hypothetical protein [Brevibacillus sp.]